MSGCVAEYKVIVAQVQWDPGGSGRGNQIPFPAVASLETFYNKALQYTSIGEQPLSSEYWVVAV